MEEGELLRAVRLVFGDIEINRDEADVSSPPLMARNHRVGERLAHGEQHPRGGRVLEARDRRLRRQARAVDRVAVQQHFVDRIVGEPVADAVRHARRCARLVAVRAASSPSCRSAALSRIAPPSELACG